MVLAPASPFAPGRPSQLRLPGTLGDPRQFLLVADNDPLKIESTFPCPLCGETMRVVGIESDDQSPACYILTFECKRGHIDITMYPRSTEELP
jgi:hypothetical protein